MTLNFSPSKLLQVMTAVVYEASKIELFLTNYSFICFKTQFASVFSPKELS